MVQSSHVTGCKSLAMSQGVYMLQESRAKSQESEIHATINPLVIHAPALQLRKAEASRTSLRPGIICCITLWMRIPSNRNRSTTEGGFAVTQCECRSHSPRTPAWGILLSPVRPHSPALQEALRKAEASRSLGPLRPAGIICCSSSWLTVRTRNGAYCRTALIVCSAYCRTLMRTPLRRQNRQQHPPAPENPQHTNSTLVCCACCRTC